MWYSKYLLLSSHSAGHATVLPHEFGHIVMGAGHTEDDTTNLMYSTSEYSGNTLGYRGLDIYNAGGNLTNTVYQWNAIRDY